MNTKAWISKSIFLGLLAFNASALSTEAISKKNSELKKRQQLTVSTLPKWISRNAIAGQNLTYTEGHNFYDTKVHLVDENGTIVHCTSELDKSKHYTVVVEGSPTIYSQIWFFSAEGREQVFNGNDSDKCLAEDPCSNFTQNVVDGISRQLSDSNEVTLWFAPGTYTLPQEKKGKVNAAVIELFNNASISGRTKDYKYPAEGNDRALFLGTLSWNGYTHHGGFTGTAKAIRVQSINNDIKDSNGNLMNTAIYTSDMVYVYESDLVSSTQSNNPAIGVRGEFAAISQSDLVINGNVYAKGIDAPTVALEYSNLKVTSKYSAVGIITGYDSSYLSVNNSSLNISGDKAEGILHYSDRAAMLYSIDLKVSANRHLATGLDCPNSGIVILKNSKIKIKSKSTLEVSSAVYASSGEVSIIKSNISAVSDFAANAIVAYSLYFDGEASNIYESSPNSATPITVFDFFANNSTPASLCAINHEQEKVCVL